MASNSDFKALSHHAYYLIGNESTRDDLAFFLEKEHDVSTQANPDFFNRSYQTFTIDDAREVKSFHNTRPVTATGKKIFILQMNGITVEAQNALLKLLEEPAEYAHFFLVVSSAHLLLPTVRSRMQLMEIDSGSVNPELLNIARKLITLSKAKRLEEVKKLLDEISKEKKTKQDAIDLLNAIQAVIYAEKGAKNGRSELEAIETARKYIHDRAPSVKMLLEYVMLNI